MNKILVRMKVLALVVALLGISISGTNAQVFKNKDKVLNLGLGFGGSYYNYHGYDYSMSFPLVSASLEFCVKDGVGPGAIGLGGYLGFTGSHYRNNYSGYSSDYFYTGLGFRGAYHLTDLAEDFDLYGGLGLGFVIVNGHDNYNDRRGSYSDWSIFLGARYYINSRVALMAEIGGGFYNVNLGVAFKLK
jgi:hypothetical protein